MSLFTKHCYRSSFLVVNFLKKLVENVCLVKHNLKRMMFLFSFCLFNKNVYFFNNAF